MNDSHAAGLERLKEKFLAFQIDSIDEATKKLLDGGVAPYEILGVCQKCMEKIGEQFETGEYFLPELVIAGEMFKGVSDSVKPLMSSDGEEKRGKIVIGTPKGDMHNLGKDIFSMLAGASGFTVYDLGVDVPPETFVEKIEETGAQILGVSVLITTGFEPIKKILRLLAEKGLRERVGVIVGGGVTTREMVDRFGLDAQTRDAYEGIRIIQQMMVEREEG